ncbi:hypothetical protein [Paenibacillus eucommiae]|uniref:TetR family transcriptional regulator n=1 Tax=Paenibacillus eucommiae TaxID=1355755 RepID=A0ABS4IPW2_9BACL|nr:hypothetical protein [Paenibacillus eucommiae]MBP1989603.1 hypothetical protein [Paenibacillus eucommiae]
MKLETNLLLTTAIQNCFIGNIITQTISSSMDEFSEKVLLLIEKIH